MTPNFSRRATVVADALALACIAAMATVPFLHPRHFNPIPSFWSEWWAFVFGLGASALLLIRPGVWRPFGLPGVAAIPVVFLVMALVQYFCGRWDFVEPWLLYASYLLWALLLMLAAQSFVARRGLEPLAQVLAAALLAGALANTAAAALQFHHIGYRSGWVFVRLGSVPYSNLGQANHFNHELWLGIGSLYYLHVRERCRLALALPALLLLLFAATMSTSRSILLYAFALTALAGFMRWTDKENAQARKLWRLTLPLLPLVFLLQWAVTQIDIAGDSSLPTATQRLFNEVGGYQIRWRLARSAWEAFVHAPLLGNGIGTLPWQFFISNSNYPLGMGPAVAEHTHNLPLQLLAEYGIVPVALMLGLLLRWAVAMARQAWQPEQWWLVSLLAVAAIHSMLEYPLWYSFFLGIAAVLLGASDRPASMLHNGRRGAAMCALVIAAGSVPLAAMRLDYARLEKRFNAPLAVSGSAWQETIEDMIRIQRDSLLAPHVMAALASMMELNNKELEAKVEVCKQGMRFAPSRRIVFKCGSLMALAGDEKGALQQTELALRAYPEEASRLVTDLKALLPAYPQLKPLLLMSTEFKVQSSKSKVENGALIDAHDNFEP